MTKTKPSSTTDDNPRIITELDGHVMKIALNRGHKMNAYDLRMLRELAKAYTAFDDNDEARCAVVYANGDNFTAGLDLAEVGPTVESGKPFFS